MGWLLSPLVLYVTEEVANAGSGVARECLRHRYVAGKHLGGDWNTLRAELSQLPRIGRDPAQACSALEENGCSVAVQHQGKRIPVNAKWRLPLYPQEGCPALGLGFLCTVSKRMCIQCDVFLSPSEGIVHRPCKPISRKSVLARSCGIVRVGFGLM